MDRHYSENPTREAIELAHQQDLKLQEKYDVMFTDLVGSTAMTSDLGDQQSMHLLRIHNALTRNAIRDHHGREIKHTGDGFMVSFVSAENSILCVKAIQQAFAEHGAKSPQQEMHVKIGLSAGEPVEGNNDLFGSTVQMAARVCDKALTSQLNFMKFHGSDLII
jgi:class 3 adenylate cyclase